VEREEVLVKKLKGDGVYSFFTPHHFRHFYTLHPIL
jgi:hypothetical protein